MYLGGYKRTNIIKLDENISATAPVITSENTKSVEVLQKTEVNVKRGMSKILAGANAIKEFKDSTNKQKAVEKEIVYVDRIVEVEKPVYITVESNESNFFGDYIPDELINEQSLQLNSEEVTESSSKEYEKI